MKKKSKRDFLSFSDYSQKEIWELLLLAARLKKKPMGTQCKGKTVGLIFQKPSTRTSVSFAVGVVQLGGHPLILNADLTQIKRGESPKDTGRVLSRYLDAIVIRATHHTDITDMASVASVPIINGLTNEEHPCQVLADLLTIIEKKKLKHPKNLKGVKVAYVGDGNNVAQSWMLAAGLLGMKLSLACPKGYAPKDTFFEKATQLLKKGKGEVTLSSNPSQAADKADVLYTDVWASMGQESESQNRKKVFQGFQINASLLSQARSNVLVMHCLPAHRGEEITEEVLEGPHSVVFDQAENRLHVQKAILASLLKGSKR